jgi:uncharacterized phage protein gp47/JayE
MAAYEYITSTGIIVPDTSDISNEVISEYKDVFGQDLDTTANTPQGILINAEVFSRDGISSNNANLANQINPDLAGGVFLDAIGALTLTSRISETFSFVTANIAGVPFTVIPAGVTASSNGFIFASETVVTLNSIGQASVIFSSVLPGPIDCPIGTLNTIVNGPLGWETITNPSAAILGTDKQSDQEYRLFRNQTLALQGTSTPFAITSALMNTPGVRSLTFLENVTNVTTVIETITLVPHSIWVCVDGGSDNDIGFVLVAKKSGGCNYNGSVMVNVVDPSSGQTYPVLFDRPTSIPILVRVTISISQSVNNPVNAVKSAIIAYANGQVESEPGFVVGASVSPFELAGAVTCLHPTIHVSNLELSYASPINYVVSVLPIAINQKATITESSITVIIV